MSRTNGSGTKRSSIARTVSSLASPYLTASLFILLAGYHYVQDPLEIVLYGSIAIVFTILIPLSYIVHLQRTGRVDSVHIFDRRSRLGPLALVGVSSAVGLGILYLVGAPEGILHLAVMLFFLAATVLTASFLLKVSGHVAAWAAGTTVVLVLYGPILLPLYLAVVPIAWSRIVLEKHTPLEVLAGFLYGICTASALSWILGLW